jgi:hypothetical protein
MTYFALQYVLVSLCVIMSAASGNVYFVGTQNANI